MQCILVKSDNPTLYISLKSWSAISGLDKRSTRCLRYFSAAIFVYHRGSPIWRLYFRLGGPYIYKKNDWGLEYAARGCKIFYHTIQNTANEITGKPLSTRRYYFHRALRVGRFHCVGGTKSYATFSYDIL